MWDRYAYEGELTPFVQIKVLHGGRGFELFDEEGVFIEQGKAFGWKKGNRNPAGLQLLRVNQGGYWVSEETIWELVQHEVRIVLTKF